MDVWIGLIFPSAIQFAPDGSVFCQGQTLPINQNAALYSLLGTIFGGDGSQTFGIPDLRGRVAVGCGAATGLTPVGLGQKFGTNTAALGAANLPPHVHPAAFTPTSGSMPISITVGSGGMGLNASVGAGTINGTLTVSTANGTTSTPAADVVPAQIPQIPISGGGGGPKPVLAYGSATAPNTVNWTVGGTTNAQSAPVNGTISGNATMVNGGTVAVNPNTGSSLPFNINQPSLGLNYIIMTTGLYPTRP